MWNSPESLCRHAVLGVLLLQALLCSSCVTGGSESHPHNDGVTRLTLVTTGILQGNMAPFERHYSRGRVRRFGDPARVASVVRRIRTEAEKRGRIPILLDLGDNLSGSAEALLTKGEIIARVLGDLEPDAVLLGNLEFAHGQKALEKYYSRFSIPFVADNVFSTGKPSAADAPGGPLPFASQYVTVKAGGIRLLVTGMSPPNLKFVCLPSNVEGLTVLEGIDAPCKRAGALKRARKADLCILLSQESLATESPGLARALKGSGVDIFFGLDFDREGEVRRLGDTILLSFPGHNQGQRIRVTEIDVHPTKGIVGIESWFELVDADTVKPDPQINAYLDKARQKYRAQLDSTVARASSYMNREFFTDGDTGNLVTDAVRSWFKADMAAINSGGIAGALAPGDILLRDLYRVIPYQNRVVLLKVRGSSLLTFLKETLGRGSPLQVSGLRLEMTRKPDGERGFRLLNVTHEGIPIDPEGLYRLATNDFVLGRSPQLQAVGKPTYGPLMRKVLADYLEAHSPVERPRRGRVLLRD